MVEQDYMCPQCRHSWWIRAGYYTKQSMISRAKGAGPDVYTEIKKDKSGNKTVTYYLRKEGHCFCMFPFRPKSTKETIFEYFERKGVKV